MRFIIALTILFSNAALADDPATIKRPRDDRATITIVSENDYFAGYDDGYTNGFRVSWLSAETEIPWWIDEFSYHMPFFTYEGNKRYSFSVGQTMYAPNDLSIKALQKNERPYAGFLFGTIGLTSDTGYRLDNLQLTIGIVGESALAAQTQDAVHNLLDAQDPQGWDNQLKDELGINLSYERKWRGLYEFTPFGWGADITPHIGATIGNVNTHTNLGATVRLGYDLPSDYGPPLIRPSLPGSDFFNPSENLAWYIFAGAEGRAVAHNIFLDGNSFKNSHSVDKEILVGGLQAGLVFTYDNIRLSYTHVLRTKEYKLQPNNEQFGAITLSFKY